MINLNYVSSLLCFFDSSFSVLIVILVLKVLFWTFYFYVRAQRMRQVRMQRLIIVRSHSGVADSHFPYSVRFPHTAILKVVLFR